MRACRVLYRVCVRRALLRALVYHHSHAVQHRAAQHCLARHPRPGVNARARRPSWLLPGSIARRSGLAAAGTARQRRRRRLRRRRLQLGCQCSVRCDFADPHPIGAAVRANRAQGSPRSLRICGWPSFDISRCNRNCYSFVQKSQVLRDWVPSWARTPQGRFPCTQGGAVTTATPQGEENLTPVKR